LVNIDLLGLGMLAALEEAIPMIREHEGVELDLAHLPPDDSGVYKMLCQADTVGVFQVESHAQMATLPRMKPQCFYDLVVEVALIRPGPIVGKMVPSLPPPPKRPRACHLSASRARTDPEANAGRAAVPEAAPAHGDDGGGIQQRRGRGAAPSDGFRRSAERMEQIAARLRTGMARNGLDGQLAEDILHSITMFAIYSFPETHAAGFALIAYASAYLKRHHAAAFFAALLNCYLLGFYHPATLVKDAQRPGVVVLPIDVARSAWACALEQGALRWASSMSPDCARRRCGASSANG